MRTHFILTHQEYKLLTAPTRKTKRLKCLVRLEQRGAIRIGGREKDRHGYLYHYDTTEEGKRLAQSTLELSEGRSNQ